MSDTTEIPKEPDRCQYCDKWKPDHDLTTVEGLTKCIQILKRDKENVEYKSKDADAKIQNAQRFLGEMYEAAQLGSRYAQIQPEFVLLTFIGNILSKRLTDPYPRSNNY